MNSTVVFQILFGAFMLLQIPMQNGFPLVYSDTGTYMHSGFSNEVPMDRPIFYGLFLRHVSLAASVWLVVFVQALITTYMIYTTLGLFLHSRTRDIVYPLLIVLLAWATSLSYTVGILIPDIFTSIGILCMLNLLLNYRTSRVGSIALMILLGFSLMVHLSNLMVMTLVICILWLHWGIFQRRAKTGLLDPARLKLISFSVISAFIIIPTTHYAFSGKFTYSQGSHVFIMNHFVETGILDAYLNDNCEGYAYDICAYKEDLGWNFIWDPDSPIYKMGGWENTRNEYRAIIRDVLSTPKYAVMVARKGVEYSVIQFFTYALPRPRIELEGSAPHGQIMWHFPDMRREYHSSKQNNSNLDPALTNTLQDLLVRTSIALFAILIIFRKRLSLRPAHLILILVISLSLILNSMICSNLSTIDPRFQARVVWLFPFASIILLSQIIERRLQRPLL